VVASDTAESVRAEVLDWFHQNWDSSLGLLEWRERLVDSGWAVPSWSPSWYGRGLGAWANSVAHEAIRGAGGVAVPLGGGMGLAAPTLAEFGSDELKRRVLRPTLTGELTWCQLFSEPGAGSDLAGLATAAVRDDTNGDWLITGQKVWNTSAHHADMAMLVARTNWDVPKHHGLTYFALPMHQDGIGVRPIRQMNGHSSFNEVFLDGCRVPANNVVGSVDHGWAVAKATLNHERTFTTMRKTNFAAAAAGRTVDEAKLEAAEHQLTYVWYPQRAGRADLIVEAARAAQLTSDPLIRQAIVSLESFRLASEWTAQRTKTARALGRSPGPEGSLGKLGASELARRSAALHARLAGPSAMLAGEAGGLLHSVVAEVLLSTPAQSIAGGTDEIQRNIIGENILGLPREPLS